MGNGMSAEPLNESRGSSQSSVLGDILEMLSAEQKGEDKKTDNSIGEKVGEELKASTASQSDIFSTILSNPALLSKLPSIIAAAKPIIEAFGKQSSPAVKPEYGSEEKSASAGSEKQSEGSVQISASGKQALDRRAALLCAMKPYLCRERQDAIDYIIKLSRLGDILRSL